MGAARRGAIRQDRKPIIRSPARVRARRSGYLTQDAHLFHDSIRANLTYADPTATPARLWSVLAAARIDVLVASLPDGLDTLVGDGGFRLSGGERQRLALARVQTDAAVVARADPGAAGQAGDGPVAP